MDQGSVSSEDGKPLRGVTLDLSLEGFPILSVVQPHNRTLVL